MTTLTVKSSAWVYLFISIAALSPFLFLLKGTGWLYSSPLIIDSYMDHAYSFFYDFSYFKEASHKAARVPWIAPLFYLQKLIGPYLLSPFLTLFAGALIPALYFFLNKALFGIRASFLFFPWILFLPQLIGPAAGGIIYNNTGAVTYFLSALYLWSVRNKTKYIALTTVACGFLAASTVYTNIVYLNLFLIFPAIDIFNKVSFKFKDYASLLYGSALSLLFWGFVNRLHGRPFFFLYRTFEASRDLILNPQNQTRWHRPLEEVWTLYRYDSYHLIFLTAILGVCLANIDYKNIRTGFSRNVFLIHYAFLYLLWVVWHISGQTAFSPPDFCYPLTVAAIVAIGSLIKSSELLKIDFIHFATSTIFLWICIFFATELQHSITPSGNHTTIILTIFAFLTLFFFFKANEKSFSGAGSLVTIGFLYSIICYSPITEIGTNCHFKKEGYTAIMNIVDKLMKIEKRPGNYFVYSPDLPPIKTQEICRDLILLPPYEIAKLTSLVAGEFIGGPDSAKKIQDLEQSDFLPLKLKKGAKLVLFNTDQQGYVKDFLDKAKVFGLEFRLLAKYSESIIGNSFAYEVYELAIKI